MNHQTYQEFSLKNIKCASCVAKIEDKLNQIDGIFKAQVNLLENTLYVDYKTHNLEQEVIFTVKSLGYGIALKDNDALISEFNLENLKCVSCTTQIENKLISLNGIEKAQVNLLNKTLHIKYKAQNLDQLVISNVKKLGFGISLNQNLKTSANIWLNITLPILSGLIIMILGMTKRFMPSYTSTIGFNYGIGVSLLTFIIMIITAKQIFKSGINGFRALNFNMHSLIILGIIAAWLYSSWVILINHFYQYVENSHVYFESALIIIGLINLGAYLEDKAKNNTLGTIKALMELKPHETLIIKDNQEYVINTNTLEMGDIVKIKPGDRIPADGIIISGNSYINESMLTGESLAKAKTVGDKVIGGSINTMGAIIFEVNNVGDNTVLAEIINLVKSAQMSKPAIALLADKIARIFVPSIIIIAIISTIIWGMVGPAPKAFYTVSVFMTILIIACPCSVGLAIPVALMVGLGRSAAKGILIRNANCLNNINKLNYILLDKTGTITEGKPQVVGFTTDLAYTKNECLILIKALESNSEHPLAQAVINYEPQIIPNDIIVEDFMMVSGSGICGKINNQMYFAGSKDWILNQIKLDKESYLLADNHFTQVFLANENKIIARIEINDTIKPDSIAAIKELQNSKIKVAMVTGDNNNNANYIAGQMNLDGVYANCKPQDKINIVINLQKQGHIVAFVGDGINDAPSLSQANIGIAIGSGSDIAKQSADITLMQNSLFGINEAIKIGTAINQNMRENLFGSFIYNTVAIFIATGALYPFTHTLLNPIIASIVMSLSSLTVILNALRLRKI